MQRLRNGEKKKALELQKKEDQIRARESRIMICDMEYEQKQDDLEKKWNVEITDIGPTTEKSIL